jgi:hypothetical protein
MDAELNEKLNWSALEYEEKEKSADWFWALGIIIVTSSIAAIIFGDYFFAALLVLSGVLLGVFAVKKPETIFYELNSKGLQIGNRIYPYENIKSFWIQIEQPEQVNVRPILFIHSERIFMPIISIPINETLANDVHFIMTSKNIPEVEMREHPTDKIMEVLGF